jgi:hypothetical protein
MARRFIGFIRVWRAKILVTDSAFIGAHRTFDISVPRGSTTKWNATHGTAMNGLRRKGVKSKSRRVNRSCSGTAIGASVPSSRTSLPANDMRFTFQYSAFGDSLI